MTYDPCLHCTLPDCDEKDKRCGLTRMRNLYNNYKRQGRLEEAPPHVREAYNAWYLIYEIERAARKSEGVCA